MNNKNKILVGCLALLLALSIGYALFSDTITINGTATAKGDFNITPTCIVGPAEGTESYFEDLSVIEGGYQNETCSADDSTDTISFSTELLYPGSIRIFTAKMTNTGTIDATFPMNFSEEVSAMTCFSEDIDADAKTEGQCTTSDTGEVMIAYAVQVGDGEIYRTDDLEALPSDVQSAFYDGTNYVLKPGNSIYYYGVLQVSKWIGDDNFAKNGVLNMYQSYTAKATFTQATN